MKSGRIWTHEPENLVYHANHQTTADLINGKEII